MAQLSQMLAQVRANEIAAAEKALANQINAQLPQPAEIDEHTRLLLAPYVKWCSDVGVRSLPAAPTTCAMFILNEAKVGIGPERIAAEAQAIEQLHDQCGLANPMQTRAARWALDQALKPEPPRSWPKEEKAMFVHLPVQIRHVIADREKDREKTLRVRQNELAEQRKALEVERQQFEQEKERLSAAATSAADNTEKEVTTMPDKYGNNSKKEQGTDVDTGFRHKNGQPGKSKDVFNKVMKNGNRADGFSAKLDNDE